MIHWSRSTKLEQQGEQWRTQAFLTLFYFLSSHKLLQIFHLLKKDFSSIARQFSLFSSWTNLYIIILAGERIQGNGDLLGNEFARLWIFFVNGWFPKYPILFSCERYFSIPSLLHWVSLPTRRHSFQALFLIVPGRLTQQTLWIFIHLFCVCFKTKSFYIQSLFTSGDGLCRCCC